MSDESKAGEPRQDIEQTPNHQQHAQEESQREPAIGEITSPSSAQIQPSPANPDDSNKAEEYSLEWWKPRAEIFGIFAGVVVGVFVVLQYREMVRTTNEMHQAYVTDERAWVAPFDLTVEPAGEDTNYLSIKLMFKNTGKTPALNVSESHGTCWISEIPTNDPPIPNSSMMLAPDAVSFIRVSPIFNRILIEPGNLPFCVYGKIKYDDIFGIHHWTEFCWVRESVNNFRPAQVHNSCDDAKPGQPR